MATKNIPQGCIFAAKYNDLTLTPFHAIGSNTATFARTGGATKPATYFDSSGVMQKTITTNDPRYNYGYYNTTGYHAFSQVGVMIEGASTNDLSKSEEFEHGDWAKTNTTADDSDAGSSAPDGASVTSSITASAGNGTLIQSFADAGANVYTASVWIKRKTGTGTINLRANSGDGYTAIVATADWTRHQVVSSALANPDFDLQIVTNGDAIYIYGTQLENLPFASSFIPTTTAALTRNAETLKYEISGNRSVAVESCVVKLAPEFANNIIAFEAHIHESDTKIRSLFFNDVSNDVIANSNRSDNSSSLVVDLINDSWTAHTEMTLGSNVQHSSPYVAGFYQGVADGTNETADDFTNPAWGTYFWVGSDTNGVNQLYGTIFSIAFWGRVLTANEMSDLYSNDWGMLAGCVTLNTKYWGT